MTLPPTGYVVLGLVSVRPTTGHDLAAYAERSIGNFFPLTRSHVYSELERLCARGLLAVSEVPQERFPTKRVYEITTDGIEVLDGWLQASMLETPRQRNPLLVRVFFGDRLAPEQIRDLLDSYERATRERRDALQAVVDRLAERPGSRFRRATAMYGVAQAQAQLAWVAEVRPLLVKSTTQEGCLC
jgi:DNA-binding PadR family transcriptional regulator